MAGDNMRFSFSGGDNVLSKSLHLSHALLGSLSAYYCEEKIQIAVTFEPTLLYFYSRKTRSCVNWEDVKCHQNVRSSTNGSYYARGQIHSYYTSQAIPIVERELQFFNVDDLFALTEKRLCVFMQWSVNYESVVHTVQHSALVSKNTDQF